MDHDALTEDFIHITMFRTVWDINTRQIKMINDDKIIGAPTKKKTKKQKKNKRKKQANKQNNHLSIH